MNGSGYGKNVQPVIFQVTPYLLCIGVGSVIMIMGFSCRQKCKTKRIRIGGCIERRDNNICARCTEYG